MPYGIDVDVVRAGTVVLTRTFETDGEALEWADSRRAVRAAEGWEQVYLLGSDPTVLKSSSLA